MNIISKLPNAGTTIFTEMSSLANEYKAINLGQGFPDFNMSDELIDLVHKAMKDGANQYTHMYGYPLLRENIAAKCLEYKKDAQVRLSYDKDLDKIIFDHLFSEDMTPELHYTLVPYGDYEAFVWKNGIWYHTTTPFDGAPLKNDFVPKSLEKELKKKGEQNQMIPPGQKDERVPHESKDKVRDDNTN